MIAEIPIQAVLDGQADDAVLRGARGAGFLALRDVDAHLGTGALRETMLAIFAMGQGPRAAMLRHKFDPARPNVYRGYFPPAHDQNAVLEGFDLGPDMLDPAMAGDGSDPLVEPTPRPGLPGWENAVALYIAAMLRVGDAVTRSLLRGLGADEALAETLFARSISTLRLLRYPPTGAEALRSLGRTVRHDGAERTVMTKAHTDSGFVTLLWQDATGGLQAHRPEGWIDVPPAPGGLVVNFGQMLSDWTGGQIPATPHRVLGGGAERYSVPFFYEPGVDAEIAPITGAPGQAPVVYGDFLWARMQRFPNLKGVERRPAR